jgi:hypothetical protein
MEEWPNWASVTATDCVDHPTAVQDQPADGPLDFLCAFR